MGRTADTTLTVTIPASEVHSADTLVCDDSTPLYADRVTRRDGWILIETMNYGDVGRFRVQAERPLRVQVERDCQCDGSGVFRGGGGTVNGVYVGFEGTCFGCGGKGWQTRQDAIRNRTYWAKYARIAC